MEERWNLEYSSYEKKQFLIIIAVLIVGALVAYYYFYGFGDRTGVVIDESSCKALLSNYESEVVNLEYQEVYAKRYLNFSKGDADSKWKINNNGLVLVDFIDFLPNMPFYQFRTFFVWIADEFEGCGIHYTFYNETKRLFKNHYMCSGGGIEGAPEEVYIEYDDSKGYYFIAYELIHMYDDSIKSTYHITFSKNPSDLQNGLNLLNMYGCE